MVHVSKRNAIIMMRNDNLDTQSIQYPYVAPSEHILIFRQISPLIFRQISELIFRQISALIFRQFPH